MALTALGISACGSSSHAASTAGDSSKALTKIVTGTPGAAVGVNPDLTGAAGFALFEGKGQAILAKYGYTYGGNVGFLAGPPAVEALVSNKIQIAAIGSAPAVTSRAAGNSTRAILLAATKGGYWIVTPTGGVTSFADLKGKTIGSAFGTNLDQYLRYVLAQTGMTNEVKLDDIQTQDAYAALISHSIDAFAATSTEAATWVAKGHVQIIQKAEDAYPNYTSSSSVLVTQSFLTAHPNITQAFWAVYNEGQTLMKANPTAYLKWSAQQTGETLALAKETTILSYQNAPVTAASLAATVATQQFLIGQKLTKSTFSVPDWAVGAPTSS